MINPRDFIKPTTPELKEEEITVSGNFICQDCMLSVYTAVLDEDEMVLRYICAEGHENEATL